MVASSGKMEKNKFYKYHNNKNPYRKSNISFYGRVRCDVIVEKRFSELGGSSQNLNNKLELNYFSLCILTIPEGIRQRSFLWQAHRSEVSS